MQAFHRVTGAAAPLLMDDINTDQVIPSVYLKDLHADMAHGLLAFMRRHPDGTSKPDFVLEKPQYRQAPILVTGDNFGCGSSREHAVWALTAFGIRCVIGRSPAEFFRDNCLKNGLLPVTLDEAQMATLVRAVAAADGHQPFTVDLDACEIRGPDGYVCPFDIAPFERTALLEGLDDIGLTQKHRAAIEAWEARTAQDKPFLQASIADVAAPAA
ncbi:MAG: 3-isopropylmalate dehydratase small subunit [Pseudomonadota bacterium]